MREGLKVACFENSEKFWWCPFSYILLRFFQLYTMDTGGKLKLYKMFRKRPACYSRRCRSVILAIAPVRGSTPIINHVKL